jgi:hypothetical protein
LQNQLFYKISLKVQVGDKNISLITTDITSSDGNALTKILSRPEVKDEHTKLRRIDSTSSNISSTAASSNIPLKSEN